MLQPSPCWQRYPEWDNVTIIDLPCRYMPEIRYAVPSLRQEYQILANLVQESKCDVILAMDYFTLPSLPPVWIRRRLGVPITLVNNALVGITWKYGRWYIDCLTKLYSQTLGRYVLSSYDRLFFLYHDLAKNARDFLGKSMPPWEVAPVGVDLACYHRVHNSGKRHELGIAESDKVVLFVGRLAVVKRVDLIIEMTRRLTGKGLAVRTVIVGGGVLGNPATEERYRQLAQPLGSSVIFTGPKLPEEVRDYYSIADVVVQASMSEGLGSFAVLEAAACGVPSVASDVGGTREAVEHGVTGYVFDADDLDAMCNYVEILLNDPGQARAMGRQAQEKITTLFDWENIADQYEQAFQELIG